MNEVRASGVALFLLAMGSLITEISLIRVFDVLFYPNISYMIITCSLFALGLAGVYSVIRPMRPQSDLRTTLGRLSFLLALSVAVILPVMNLLPFDLNKLTTEPARQLLLFGGLYLALALPFFLTGLIFATVFTVHATHIRRLYFWDLSGAALGSVIVIPFVRLIGPGGLLMYAAASALLASALLARSKRWTLTACLASLALIAVPVANAPRYFDFVEHQGKRGVKLAREQGLIEKTVWDPISKIDIINYGGLRFIAYDGGSQTSLFYPFDGHFQRLRRNLQNELGRHFWQRGVLASHYLKDGAHPTVLVIGSAGGQEIKAALMYGARHVDAVEMVGTVVELGQNDYSSHIGGLFQHPSVVLHVAEGRSFLQSNARKYDIVQIFSNHTSSSVAAGTSAIAPNYLQTADAYREYFRHLEDDGVLHINHFYYPRMITTAALAWSQLGRGHFERHVVVYENAQDETLPTLLIKMRPWTASELERVKQFFAAALPGDRNVYTLAVDPLSPVTNTVPLVYFSGSLPADVIRAAASQIRPATDDRPYFNLSEKTLNPIANGILGALRGPLEGTPQGLITLYLTGIVALGYGVIFVVIPLFISGAGKQTWSNRLHCLVYFSCLGAGFIIVEFVFIQLFMHLIGSPLYTYSTVLFTMLMAAGLGSLTSERWRIAPSVRWFVPFVGVLAAMALMLLSYSGIRDTALAASLPVRIGTAALLMFPVGFFLGMPFPLGVAALKEAPTGAVAWAWGMNGLFTVIGGLLAIALSVQWGFHATLLIACGIYTVAFLVFARIRVTLRLQSHNDLAGEYAERVRDGVTVAGIAR